MKYIFILSFLLGNAMRVFAQHKVGLNEHSLDSIFMSGKPFDTAKVRQMIYAIPFTNNERSWMKQRRYSYFVSDNRRMDSIEQQELIRFPKGFIARDLAVKSIHELKTAAAKDSAFIAFKREYPYQKFFEGKEGDNIVYDYLRSFVASAYAAEGYPEMADRVLGELQEAFWKFNAYYGLARIYNQQGKMGLASKYALQTVDSILPFAKGLHGNSNGAQFAAAGLPSALKQAVQIFSAEGNYKEAANLINEALPYVKDQDAELVRLQALVADKIGPPEKAFSLYEKLFRISNVSEQDKAVFKRLYVSTGRGSEQDYDAYIAKKESSWLATLKDSLSHAAINEKAPPFTLVDMNGKLVSLKDYAGKVVVVDFWATWCGPCKASFPAMQMTVNKYKNDSTVVFLFIHTWERGGNPKPEITTFLKGNNYDFRILLDTKDIQTRNNEVVKSYNVDGIPAKFIIDKKGVIRYRLKGFSGSNDAAVDELSTMIELSKSM